MCIIFLKVIFKLEHRLGCVALTVSYGDNSGALGRKHGIGNILMVDNRDAECYSNALGNSQR